MIHKCHAHGCEVAVPPAMFACKPHWFSLPKAMRDAIRRECRPGQERNKNPSARYLAVQQRAIGMMAFRPNDENAAAIAAHYTFRAEQWRLRAIDGGHGDPLAFLEGP